MYQSKINENDYLNISRVLLADDLTDISYNSAAVCVHLVADGEDAWKGMEIDRDLVMKAIVKVPKYACLIELLYTQRWTEFPVFADRTVQKPFANFRIISIF